MKTRNKNGSSLVNSHVWNKVYNSEQAVLENMLTAPDMEGTALLIHANKHASSPKIERKRELMLIRLLKKLKKRASNSLSKMVLELRFNAKRTTKASWNVLMDQLTTG